MRNTTEKKYSPKQQYPYLYCGMDGEERMISVAPDQESWRFGKGLLGLN